MRSRGRRRLSEWGGLLSVVRPCCLLGTLVVKGEQWLHEHFVTRFAARSSFTCRSPSFYFGGGALAGHWNRREYCYFQHCRWAVASAASVQRSRTIGHTLEPF